MRPVAARLETGRPVVSSIAPYTLRNSSCMASHRPTRVLCIAGCRIRALAEAGSFDRTATCRPTEKSDACKAVMLHCRSAEYYRRNGDKKTIFTKVSYLMQNTPPTTQNTTPQQQRDI